MPKGRPAGSTNTTNTLTTANRNNARAITQSLQTFLEQGWYYGTSQGVHFIGETPQAVAQVCHQWQQGMIGTTQTTAQGSNQFLNTRQRKPMSAQARANIAAARRKSALAQRKAAGQAQSSTGRQNQKTMAAGQGNQ